MSKKKKRAARASASPDAPETAIEASDNADDPDDDDAPKRLGAAEYNRRLRELQIELVKLQRHFIRDGERILVLLEGRDAAGKDGTIKRITEHLSPRETRTVALGPPSDREQTSWYFQRYIEHLPAGGELVLFNRSWYNRAGVERVMGFSNHDQYEDFMASVLDLEHMLTGSGIRLFKYYLDISKAEQLERLEDRRDDPLAQWKISSLDAKAQELWGAYTDARNDMLRRTHDPGSPWLIVRADHKKTARIALISDMLSRLDYEGKSKHLLDPPRDVVFEFTNEDIERLAP